MPTLPVLRSGFLTFLTSDFERSYKTDMVRAIGEQEQRWQERVMRASFTLVYNQVNSYDLNIIKQFFYGQKGRYVDAALANTFSITAAEVPGQPYNYCFFDQDDITEVEQMSNRYSFTLRIRQARGN